MEALKIFMLLNLLAWSIIVGQAWMYIIALSDVSKKMDAPSYIQLRQLIDKNFMAKYRWVVYFVLISSVLLCVFTAAEPAGILFISSAIAMLCLVIDTLLTMKGNLPINKLINGWTTDKYPDDWEIHRTRWLSIYARRQVVNIIGFTSLLAGAIFGS